LLTSCSWHVRVLVMKELFMRCLVHQEWSYSDVNGSEVSARCKSFSRYGCHLPSLQRHSVSLTIFLLSQHDALTFKEHACRPLLYILVPCTKYLGTSTVTFLFFSFCQRRGRGPLAFAKHYTRPSELYMARVDAQVVTRTAKVRP
jgi:hypothetical protein